LSSSLVWESRKIFRFLLCLSRKVVNGPPARQTICLMAMHDDISCIGGTMAARNHLPSLNLLRGFEAAARHLSFTKAADELNVTQGAISRQIRELEWFFGKPLFIRMTRKIALTREGEVFFEHVREALDKIDDATLLMLRRPAHRHIKLNILPTLSTHWLM